MAVLRKHTAAQRHPAWAILLSLIVGLLLWLASASLVRGWQNAAAAEQAVRTAPVASAPTIAFSANPLLAQKDTAKNNARPEQAKPEQTPSDSKNPQPNRKRPVDKNIKDESTEKFSSQDETAVQEFLAANHPELGQVLGSLKKKHAREYAKAIHDLSHTQARLEQTRRNDQQRYERDLVAWQIKSRIQLLVARIKMSPDDEKLRAELKAAVAEQIAQQRADLQIERERLQQRLDKVDTQLERLSGEHDVQIEQRMKQWLTSADGNLGQSNRVPSAIRKKNARSKASSENSSKVKLEK